MRRQKQESFWALKNVSLEVREGEVLGLIGRNGAGKTTLLKILSRITGPTAGWGRKSRASGESVGGGDGVPSGADGTGKYLFERGDTGDAAAGESNGNSMRSWNFAELKSSSIPR